MSVLMAFFLSWMDHVLLAEDSFADQFLGSPFLILAAFVVIAAIAFIYHKIRR